MDYLGESIVKDAINSLRNIIATDPRDWSVDKRDAWIYAIIVGWEGALGDVAEQHGWNRDTRVRLQAMAAKFAQASGKS